MQKRSVPAVMEEGIAAAPVEVVGSGPTHISLFLSFFETGKVTSALVILNDSGS